VRIASIGDIAALRTSECAFCRFLSTVGTVFHGGVNTATLRSESADASSCSLYAFSSSRSYEPGYAPIRGPKPQGPVLLGLVPKQDIFPHWEKINCGAFIASTTGALSNESDESGFRVRRLQDKIDFQVLRKWIVHCRTTHGLHALKTGGMCSKCSEETSLTGAAGNLYREMVAILKDHAATCSRHSSAVEDTRRVPGFRLIDCDNRRVVAAPSSCDYLALSYVWGRSNPEDECEVADLGSRTLPAVIEDAMLAVVQLGFRYLWVDRYCIDQNSEEDKHSQIKVMDLIYQRAVVTIIAAAGAGPDYGLPGVGNRPRRTQPSLQVDDHVLLSTLCHPASQTLESEWITRGWTYQEAVFSQRRLIFTDEQAYFECEMMTCCEAVDTYPEKYQKRGASYEHNNRIFRPVGQTSFDIRAHIAEYSKRKLTYSNDALDAFLGILQAFRRSAYPVYHYWGIPIVRPWYSAPSAWTKEFLRGLCWALSNPSPAREGYPSWSWTGWEGSVKWIQDDSSDISTTVNVWVESGPDHPTPWEDFREWVENNDLTKPQTLYLHIEADTMDLQFEYLDPRHPPAALHCTSDGSIGAGFYVRYTAEPLSFSPLILTREMTPGDKLYKELEGRSWSCIVVGENRRNRLVLVIDSAGRRVGHVDFSRRLLPMDFHIGFFEDFPKADIPVARRRLLLQ
jgi:Heterokaryon incompatibility protein (HET)